MKDARSRIGWYALACALTLADQVVKYWIRATMALGERRDFIPLVELYYVENTGGAFSLLSEHTWLLALLSAVMTVLLALAIWKGWFSGGWLNRLGLSLLLAGAGGNLIDRGLRGSVTDMFNFTFIRFGIFNVADMCVVVGVAVFALSLLLELREGGHEADPAGE